MKRSTTYLLATFAAVALAACGPRRPETTTGGSETGATSGTGSTYDSSSATGTAADTTQVKGDSAAR
jgi:hypothetical protein